MPSSHMLSTEPGNQTQLEQGLQNRWPISDSFRASDARAGTHGGHPQSQNSHACLILTMLRQATMAKCSKNARTTPAQPSAQGPHNGVHSGLPFAENLKSWFPGLYSQCKSGTIAKEMLASRGSQDCKRSTKIRELRERCQRIMFPGLLTM